MRCIRVVLRFLPAARVALKTCLTVTGTLVTMIGLPAHAQSLSNGGFEGSPLTVSECANVTGTVSQGWTDNTCWDAARPVIEYAQDAVNPHGGLTAQRMTLKSGTRVQFAQFLGTPLDKSLVYTVSVWMRALQPTFVTLALRQTSAPYEVFASKMVKLTSVWQRYSFSAATPGGDSVLLITSEFPGTFWLDDATLTGSADTAALAMPSATISKRYFGMHLNYSDTAWPQVNGAIGAVRIWDAGRRYDGTGPGAQWSEISAARGVNDWSGLDARVTGALSQGADLLMTLGGRTPRWASARPDETSSSPAGGSPYGPGEAAEPANMQDWRDWVRAVALRYKGRIKYWEVWNEPMYRMFYTGTPDKLIELCREAYLILKEVDPTNQVLTPSGDLAYLDYLLSNGALNYADIVNTHFYVDQPEDIYLSMGRNVRLMLNRIGAGAKPLWNSEAGWLDVTDNPAQIPQEQGAALVARAHILSWAIGASRFYWYTWDSRYNQFRMREADDRTLTPSGTSYREVAGWLTGSIMQSVETDDKGIWRVQLRRADGSSAYIVWHPTQSATFTVPLAWNIRSQRDLQGATRTLAGGAAIPVGIAPVLLLGAPVSVAPIVLDNLGAGAGDTLRAFTGKWCPDPAGTAQGGAALYSCGPGLDTYRWTPNVAVPGVYDVYVRWVSRASRSGNVPIRVAYAGGGRTKYFDQRNNGAVWVAHGRWPFAQGSAGYVEISDANGEASADAIRLIYVGPLAVKP